MSASGCSPGLVGCKERLAWRAIRPRRWRREPQRRRRTLSCCSDSAEVRWHRWRPRCGAEERFLSVAAILFKGSSWFVFSAFSALHQREPLLRQKNAVFTDGNGIFCVFTPQPTCTLLTSLHSPPNNPTQAAEQPYTAGRSILHNVGFNVGFKHQTLHT